jgi:hypothetical protein
MKGGQVPAAVKQISGKKLAKQLKTGAISPDFAARLAYDLNTGHLAVSRLTAKQSRWLTGATCADLARVRREMRATNGNSNGGNGRVLYRHDVADSDVDAIVTKVGAERVMASLDRLTKPRCERTVELFGASIAR